MTRGAGRGNGRAAAVDAVAAALGGRRFASEALAEGREAGRLSGREAGLAREIAQGALRHLVTIEHVLERVARLERERTKPALRAVLYSAAYQMIWMDRVPLFAAVDEAVELARRRVGGRAPGMTNAVLRRLADAIATRRDEWRRLDPRQVRTGWATACGFARAVLPDAEREREHLAAATGERPARYETLVQRHGAEAAERVAWASQAVPPIVLHRHVLRIPAEEFARRVVAETDGAAELAGDSAFLPPATATGELGLIRDGLAYVQDTTAHAAARAVGARRGERVLDLCAAPGGKSIVLALDMEDRGEVLACDARAERLARVRENALRLELACVQACAVAEDGRLSDRAAPFDAALVDVPCTNTGVIARRPEARLGLRPTKLEALRALQRRLLRQGAAHVRTGGRLVYSTCSLEPQENEEIVREFVQSAAWRLDEQRLTLPDWGPRLADWHDGGYWARLVRAE